MRKFFIIAGILIIISGGAITWMSGTNQESATAPLPDDQIPLRNDGEQRSENDAIDLPQAGAVSWPQAVRLLRQGSVAAVTQLHNRQVILTLKNEQRVVTSEPTIDDINREIESCGTACSDVIMATE